MVCVSCSPEEPSRPTGATIEILYEAPTAKRDGLDAFPDCVNSVVRTHLHPSWKGFPRVSMEVAGDQLWRATFQGMRPGEYSIRVDDINLCGIAPSGTVTEPKVTVNGVRLERLVDTPSESGLRPGFAFVVGQLGTVSAD
jgi:hypothetical protein